MTLTRRHRIGVAAALVALAVAGAVRYSREPVEPLLLGWNNLVPPEEQAAAEAAARVASGLVYDLVTPENIPVPDRRALQPKQARVIDALDGKEVSIAGYVVPLEFDGTKVRLFLLVPYFGACIHVPPPPPNQIILVRLAQAVAVNTEFDPVVVTGRMRVASASTNLADVGYQITARDVTPYE